MGVICNAALALEKLRPGPRYRQLDKRRWSRAVNSMSVALVEVYKMDGTPSETSRISSQATDNHRRTQISGKLTDVSAEICAATDGKRESGFPIGERATASELFNGPLDSSKLRLE